MSSFDDVVEVEHWRRDRVLGSGGFGTVTLWKHKHKDQMIALKKCRGGADTLLTAKQKERWKKEVEIMQRLNHPNVVRALPLPDDLAKLASDLPMLCMEYCKKGDLRQLLNRPENCCGLPETDVRRLIQNVSSAIHYLHSEKITHRDLKPENIVLSQSDAGIIYKLIDLGYAKELDQSSICTSFVGTLQYLAPELFTNEKYSSSVDYWSLGLVSHEVITGVRPFLPSMAPVAWMKHVRKKSPDHICAYQTADGKIEFSSHLFPQNHICRVLKNNMERWLRIALEWDPKKRGRNPDGEIVVFSEIQNILSKKILQVFCMVTYERLSYEVEEFTELSELRLWIETDTKLPVQDQELLLASGQHLDPNGTVQQCFNGRTLEALYVCKRGTLQLPTEPPGLPELVAHLLQSPREKLEYILQRRAYGHSVFFLQQENKLYRDFLVGCRLKLLSMVLECQKVVRVSQRVMDLTNSVLSVRELCLDTFKFDVMQAKKLELTSATSTWQPQINSIECKWTDLSGKAKKLTINSQKLTKAARKLQTSDTSNAREDATLNSQLEESLGIMDKLRRRPNSERSTLRDSLDMVKVLYNSLKQRDCLLRNVTFNEYLQQLVDCQLELHQLLPNLEETANQLEQLKREIVTFHRDKQGSIWKMLASPSSDWKAPSGSVPSVSHNPLSSSDSSFLFRSISSRSLYSEENPPPVPPHGTSMVPRLGSADNCASQLPNFSSISSHSTSQPKLHSTSSMNLPAFDTSDLQQILTRSSSVNGTDSGISNSVNGSATKVSSMSLLKELTDDVATSMINENKSLRALTQELMMESLSQLNKALTTNQEFDWSFLKTS